MNNNRTENFQRVFFKHVDSLLQSGYFILRKKDEVFHLRVSNEINDLTSNNLEKVFFKTAKICNQKDLGFHEGYEYISKMMLDSVFAEKVFTKNNIEIERSLAVFEEYKKDFLNDNKVVFKLTKSDESNSDIYSYENKYRNKDLNTQMVLFNVVLPLINYFEKNNYEIKEMFDDIKTVGEINLFPAVEVNSVSGYYKLDPNLEDRLENFTMDNLTTLKNEEVKIFLINEQYKLGASIRGKYIIGSDNEWNKISQQSREFLSSFESVIKNEANNFLSQKVNEYGDKWNVLEKTYDFAKNKANIFNILQKAFTLPFEELSDYRDSLLSDKKSMLYFENAKDFRMTKDYHLNFSKIVQNHLEKMEIEEIAKSMRKRSLDM